ncbi:MAG: sugar phosphate isomerase/epimerase [Chloroflexia bacterium]|nr:sugar phosphate isomerase/epimerase [Chloroflexia bacterium]
MTTGNDGNGPWSLGCQLRPWLQTWGAEGLAARLTDVIEIVAAIGYDGFETVVTALPLDDPAGFREATVRAGGLRLAAAHAGGPWWQPEGNAIARETGERARGLPALGCDRLVVSMTQSVEPLTDYQTGLMIANLRTIAAACRTEGVSVAFHNHAAELARDAELIATIVGRLDPAEMGLGTDLGWVVRGGADPLEFVSRFGDRLAYLHVRDLTVGPDSRFTEIGQGAEDIPALLRALEGAGYRGWLVAESEFGDGWRGATDPEQPIRRQFVGLRTALLKSGVDTAERQGAAILQG